MARHGFEPEVRARSDGADIVLHHCPFAATAAVDRDTICALHLGIAEGLTAATPAEVTDLVAPEFVASLERAVRMMHARGVAHLDLRHRSNVLVGEDGEPILIDFASALCFHPGGVAARWLLPLFARYDLRAVEKWRQRLHHVWPAVLRDRALRQAAAEPAAPRSGGTSRG